MLPGDGGELGGDFGGEFLCCFRAAHLDTMENAEKLGSEVRQRPHACASMHACTHARMHARTHAFICGVDNADAAQTADCQPIRH